MDLATLKNKLNINNTSYDYQLEDFLDFIYLYLSGELGVDLSKINTNLVKTFYNTYLNSTICPIDSWKSVTKVEVATKSPNLTWVEILEYQNFEFNRNTETDYSLTALKGDFKNKIVRISGVYGYSDTNTGYPSLIESFVFKAGQAYFNDLKTKGKSVESERSGNLSVTFNLSKILSGLEVINPAKNKDLANLIKKYKAVKKYPYL